MSELKYKVGDKVRIKSLDWYNENKNEHGNVDCGFKQFTYEMSKFCGQTMIITNISSLNEMTMGMSAHYWTDGMIEGLVEEETTNVLDEDKMLIGWIKEPNRYRLVPDKDYEIKYDEKGFFYLEKKKKSYPKSYEECFYVLGFENTELVFEDDYRYINPPKEQWKRLGLMNQLNKLLICRDAYWKITGEEMGLGKPWEPDWNDDVWPDMYYISFDGKHIDKEKGYPCCNMILIFPTEEMRDAFYDNFKKEIEICKKLL